MKRPFIILLTTALLADACTENESTADNIPQSEEVFVNLSVQTRAATDPIAVNQDQEFSSLAIYLFNNDAGFSSDQSVLLPSFTSVGTKEIPVRTVTGTKILYLLANYVGKTFRLSNGSLVTLSPSTTKDELDRLVTESSNGFSSASLLMVGKQTLTFGSGNNGSTVGIALRRLQSRVDVHVYKGANFGANTVTLDYYNFTTNSWTSTNASGTAYVRAVYDLYKHEQ